MALYNIYHGLGGGFGGAQYDYTRDFNSRAEAYDEAYDCAVEDYQSYEGLHGILSQEDVKKQYMEENNIENEETLTNRDYAAIEEEYIEEIEGWIDYDAILADEDDDISEEEREYL